MRLFSAWLVVAFLVVPSVSTCAFENLDFEDAMPVFSDPFDISFQLPADVLPSWTIPGTANAYLNGGHIGLFPAIFSVFDGNLSFNTLVDQPIEGDYSLLIDSVQSNAELSQTGLVPSLSKSVRFFGDSVTNFGASESLDLYLGGSKLDLIELGPAGAYKEFGANIPATLANTQSELRFVLGQYNVLAVDDIHFSPLPVPEPATLTFSMIAATSLAAMLNRRRN